MTTTEATIAMVNRLSDAEMLDVQRYMKRLLARREAKKSELKPVSKKEFLKMLKRSDDDIATGKVYSWEQVREDMRARYGV